MQRVMLNAVALAVTGLITMTPSLAHTQTPEEKGQAVAERADREDSGWHDNASVMRMVLRNKSGQESVRELRRKALESTERDR